MINQQTLDAIIEALESEGYPVASMNQSLRELYIDKSYAPTPFDRENVLDIVNEFVYHADIYVDERRGEVVIAYDPDTIF
tara:strand:+ start:286 stop:525 length:240 start_codon:yes stop_codon:yes gene_type:complete